MRKFAYKCLLISSISSLLFACGSGSSNSNANNNINNDATAPRIEVIGSNFHQQQAIDLLLYSPDQNVSNITWQQKSGPSVTLLAQHSKAIGFTAEQAGDYVFEVQFEQNGVSQSLSQSISVDDATAKVNARLGHAVLEGNGVSLRAWLSTNIAGADISWQQTSGPTVSLTNYQQGDLAIFFDAPSVSKDEIIKFTATATLNGTEYQDEVAVLVENAPAIANNAYFDDRKAQVFPYNSDSPFADKLVGCTYSNQLSSSCKLGDLPLIAQTTTEPSVDDIMNRVVVSHQWMGDRFKAFLEQYDTNNDFKHLLRATTAVVIAYDVRPSFYWAATGAIYLDPDNFWLTPEERDTINEAPDYRAAFGNDLQFVMPWRYVKNNQYATSYFPATSRVSRTSSQALYRLASLLYHELAHANDFFPSTEWQSHSDNERILDAAQSSNFESDQLDIAYPLQSSTMRALAAVSFLGNSATDTQKAYQPADIVNFFAPDGATDYYNFSTIREDYAMLFEELMMFSRYQVQRDVAITNRPTGDMVYANDYIVTWGQRGRAGENQIRDRVKFVVARVLPEFDGVTAVNNLPSPIAMRQGDDWIENLQLSAKPTNQKATLAHKLMKQAMHDNHRYYHRALPTH